MCTRKLGAFSISACLVSFLLAIPVLASSGPPAQVGGTVIWVNTTSDDGHNNQTCSLREAILAANGDSAVDACSAGSGVDLIRVPAGLYRVDLSGPGEDEGLTGDLDVLQSVIIEGDGGEKTIIEPLVVVPERILHLHASATVEIRNLQIRRANLAESETGSFIGGGIYNAGSLRLSSAIFTQNQAASSGGGIYNTGSLEITDTRFIDNSAGQNGGAIRNKGTLTLLRGYFSGNTSGSGGAIENAAGAQATITDTDFIENSDGETAGAIEQAGQMTLRKSEFWRNASTDGAGALRNQGTLVVEDCLFSGNDSSFGAAAINQSAGRLTILRSRFISNLGIQGGALLIENTQETRVEASQFLDNSAYHGAGIHQRNGPTTILNSTFEGNGGYSGGGIEISGSGVYISGCTINNNGSSFEGGSGIHIYGEAVIENTTISGNHSYDEDGAVTVFGGRVTLINTTVVRNTGIGIATSDGTVILKSSLIAENWLEANESIAQDCINRGDAPSGQIISQGFNLVGTTRGCPWTPAQGDLLGTETSLLDPRLAALANYGGPTQTHALLPGSPAIDSGGMNCPATDQRGMLRPFGAACDIGAYELTAGQLQYSNLQYLPAISR